MSQRPEWDQYFLLIAERVSLRGTCPRRKVGVAIVDKSHHIVSTGYNGAPPGQPSCDEEGCSMVGGHCKRAIHGDMNALLHGPRGNLSGHTMYIYGGTPCLECAYAIREARIDRVVCYGAYTSDDGKKYLQQNGVAVEVVDAVERPIPSDPTIFEEALKAIADEVVQTVLRKDHDYGKAADSFGELGVAVRSSDKVNRLKHLLHNPSFVKDESTKDTWLDLAGYALLGYLIHEDQYRLPSLFAGGDGTIRQSDEYSSTSAV